MSMEEIREGHYNVPLYIWGNSPFFPKITYEWEFISEGRSKSMVQEKYEQDNTLGDLTIKQFKEETEGVYKCYVVKNNERTLIRQINARIIETVPKILEDFKERFSVPFYRSKLIYCTAEGYPKPKITWILPSGRRIEGRDVEGKLVRTNHQGMLLIEKALTKTAGSYSCIASNSKGVMYRNVYIDVLPGAPRLTLRKKKTALVGRNIRLRCNAVGNPEPIVRWRKMKFVGEKRCHSPSWQFNSTEEIKFYRISFRYNGDLLIKNVRLCDRGIYYCSAKNSQGEVEVSGKLQVNFDRIENLPSFLNLHNTTKLE